MRNTTISLDETTLELGKKAATTMGLSLNAYIKQLLENSLQNHPSKVVRELVALSEKLEGQSKNKKWSRDKIYER